MGECILVVDPELFRQGLVPQGVQIPSSLRNRTNSSFVRPGSKASWEGLNVNAQGVFYMPGVYELQSFGFDNYFEALQEACR